MKEGERNVWEQVGDRAGERGGTEGGKHAKPVQRAERWVLGEAMP